MERLPRWRCARASPCSPRAASSILPGERARPGQNSPRGLALQIQCVFATAKGFARSMWDPRQPGKIKTQAPQQLATTSKNTPRAKPQNPRAPEGFARTRVSRTVQNSPESPRGGTDFRPQRRCLHAEASTAECRCGAAVGGQVKKAQFAMRVARVGPTRALAGSTCTALQGATTRRITPHARGDFVHPPRRNPVNTAPLPLSNRGPPNNLRSRDEAKSTEFRLAEKIKNLGEAKCPIPYVPSCQSAASPDRRPP
jgi:hypothetical protein